MKNLINTIIVITMFAGVAAHALTDGNWSYDVNKDNTCILTHYNGKDREIVIPSTLGGHAVISIRNTSIEGSIFATQRFGKNNTITSVTVSDGIKVIDYRAFARSLALKTVVLPDSVKIIGSKAFQICEALESINIPNNVVEIGIEAFAQCFPLKTITLPNSLKTIKSDAFVNCDSLRTIKIPYSVSLIQGWAFRNCDNLSRISVDVNNPNYCDIDGVLFDKTRTAILQYPSGKTATSYTIPDHVTTIGTMALSDSKALKRVIIPDSVKIIEKYAFCDSAQITSIVIPDSVISIGERAFCRSLSIHAPRISHLKYAIFKGDAPAMGTNLFDNAAPEFKIYYYAGKTGFTNINPATWGDTEYKKNYPLTELTATGDYILSVVNGDGSGNYNGGEIVSINAADPVAGKLFKEWTGDTDYVTDVTSKHTTVTMLCKNIKLTAVYNTSEKPEQ